MDAKRYAELFTDVERWVQQARRLKIAADELYQPTFDAFASFHEDHEGAAQQAPGFLNDVERARALSDARALLYGLAIENAAKARLIVDRQITIDASGRPRGLRSDHDLLKLVRQAGYTPSSEKAEFLVLLAYQTRTLARYPIAKNLNAQNEFSGRAVGALLRDSHWTDEIIVDLLREKKLVDLFRCGFFAKDPLPSANPNSSSAGSI